MYIKYTVQLPPLKSLERNYNMSKEISNTLNKARKIVIKIGSNTLAKSDGTQNIEFMQNFARQCKSLIDIGKQVAIVSSGAQVCGVSTTKKWARKKDVYFRQALCAIGQVELMSQWRKAFAMQNLHIGQLLFTRDDFENDHRSLNIRNTLFTLADEGIVPIINENDSVSFEEDSIGDNDNLSALTAILWSADLLILLSDVDGVYFENPKENPNAQLIETVSDIGKLRTSIKIGETNSFGTGGIETKIQAAEKTTVYGIPLLLTNGSKQNIIEDLLKENAEGTLFLANDPSFPG